MNLFASFGVINFDDSKLLDFARATIAPFYASIERLGAVAKTGHRRCLSHSVSLGEPLDCTHLDCAFGDC